MRELATISAVLFWLQRGLLIVCGWWLYRHIKLHSIPWLTVYLLLSPILEILQRRGFSQWIGPGPGSGGYIRQTFPFGWTLGMWIAWWSYMTTLVSRSTQLILTILILSDIVYLVRRSGIELSWKPAQILLYGRQYSTPLGIILVALMMVMPTAVMLMRFR